MPIRRTFPVASSPTTETGASGGLAIYFCCNDRIPGKIPVIKMPETNPTGVAVAIEEAELLQSTAVVMAVSFPFLSTQTAVSGLEEPNDE
jgi:hypothetical protein